MTDTNQEVRETPEALTFTYTNWRGETALRRVRPSSVIFRFAGTEWHPDPEWLMSAMDLDKVACRDFAVRDIVFASAPPPAVPDAVGVRTDDGRWGFDTSSIGWFANGSTSLATRIVDRPFGLTNIKWGAHAKKVCVALNVAQFSGIPQQEALSQQLAEAEAKNVALAQSLLTLSNAAGRARLALAGFLDPDQAAYELDVAMPLQSGRILSSIEPTPSPEPQASNAGAVKVNYDDFFAAYRYVPRSKMSPTSCLKTRLRSLLREEDLQHADEAEEIQAQDSAALSTPEPQTGERDGEESPYTWVKTQRVPGTSYVGGSLMLIAEDGHCVGIVKVLSGEGATENDVHRALQTAGNPAKLQRFIRAARNGEQDANDRAEAAERRIAEVEERASMELAVSEAEKMMRHFAEGRAEVAEHSLAEVKERALAVLEDWDQRITDGPEKMVEGQYKPYWSPVASMVSSEPMAALRAALRAKPEAQAIAGKECDQ